VGPRRDDDETERSALLTACGGFIGSIGLLILVVLLPATFQVVAGTLGLVNMPGWVGDNTSTFGFYLIVVPTGIALAAIHFLVGGLILARRFWPLVVTVLLVVSVITVFPLGLRISWPFLGLTLLYTASLLLTVARQSEFG
jgi:hypothetical protein